MSLYMMTSSFATAAMSMMFYTWRINYEFLKVNKSSFFKKFTISQQVIISIKIVSLNLLNDFIIDFVWKTSSKDTFATAIFIKKTKHRAIRSTISWFHCSFRSNVDETSLWTLLSIFSQQKNTTSSASSLIVSLKNVIAYFAEAANKISVQKKLRSSWSEMFFAFMNYLTRSFLIKTLNSFWWFENTCVPDYASRLTCRSLFILSRMNKQNVSIKTWNVICAPSAIMHKTINQNDYF